MRLLVLCGKVFAGLFVAAIFSVLFHRDRCSEVCVACLTERRVTSWRVGLPFKPGSALSEAVEESPSIARRELFDSGHAHEWAGTGGCRHSLLWSQGSAAHGSYNRFLGDYEGDTEFRAFVQAKISAGSLSRDQAQRLAAFREPEELSGRIPAYPPENRVPPPATLGREDTDLLLLGRALFDEFRGGQPPQDWWWRH